MSNSITAAQFIVGIDPDCDKNGIAFYDRQKDYLQLYTLPFFDLLDFLQFQASLIKEVVIEAGWLNAKSNFYSAGRAGSKAAGERISKNVGANHEAGRKIVEMCEYLKIPHRIVKPLKKQWKGTGGKITHAEFVAITGYGGKQSNQEERDAALLVYGR